MKKNQKISRIPKEKRDLTEWKSARRKESVDLRNVTQLIVGGGGWSGRRVEEGEEEEGGGGGDQSL